VSAAARGFRTAAVLAFSFFFIKLAALLGMGTARAETRHGVRVLGDIHFQDLSGDGVADWLVGRAQCFTKREDEAEVVSPCVALVDGARWRPMWRKNIPRFGRFAPVVAGTWAVIDVGEPVFSAFDTGRVDVFWEFRLDGTLTAPMTAVGDRVLLVSGGDHVYFVSPAERRTVWEARLWSRVRLRPFVAGAYVVVTTERELAVLDVSSGRILWRFAGDVVAAEAVEQEGLYIAHRGPRKATLLAATSIATGERLWPREPVFAPDAQVVVAEDQIFAFTRQAIAAIDRQAGTAAWHATMPARAAPLGVDRRIAAALVQPPGGAQEIHAYDRETGKLLWKHVAKERRFEPKARLASGVLVVWSAEGATLGANHGLVLGLDAATGRTIWSNESGEKLTRLWGDADHIRIQRERGFTVLDARTGAEIARHASVATMQEGRPLSERLRVLVYAVPSAIILAGVVVWIRRLLRRRR
jgi:outer membrane protein assembly factor BamB